MTIEHEGVSPGTSKLDSPSHLAQLERTRQIALEALKDYSGPEISLEEVREMLDTELQGVSLGDLVIEERRQSY